MTNRDRQHHRLAGYTIHRAYTLSTLQTLVWPIFAHRAARMGGAQQRLAPCRAGCWRGRGQLNALFLEAIFHIVPLNAQAPCNLTKVCLQSPCCVDMISAYQTHQLACSAEEPHSRCV